LRRIRSCFIKNKNWLVNLDPVNAHNPEFRKELLINRDELGKEGDRFKVRYGIPPSLAEEKVRKGTKNDGPSLDSKSLCFMVLGGGLL